MLRPAQEIREIQAQRERDRMREAIATRRRELAEEITGASRAGLASLHTMTIPSALREELESLGYTLEDFPAAGCGDVPTVRISW